MLIAEAHIVKTDDDYRVFIFACEMFMQPLEKVVHGERCRNMNSTGMEINSSDATSTHHASAALA